MHLDTVWFVGRVAILASGTTSRVVVGMFIAPKHSRLNVHAQTDVE